MTAGHDEIAELAAEFAAMTARRSDDERELEQLYAELSATHLETVLALADAVDARDPSTADHSNRVASMAATMAGHLGWTASEREALQWAAHLHDIGKLAVPDAVLRKPEKLTPDEFVLMRQHPARGAHIVGSISTLGPRIAPMIAGHHERFDGAGYPEGLAGDDIAIGARLLAVCDAYDAMTCERPYRASKSHEAAVAELNACAGAQFDPELVAAFTSLFRERPTMGAILEAGTERVLDHLR